MKGANLNNIKFFDLFKSLIDLTGLAVGIYGLVEVYNGPLRLDSRGEIGTKSDVVTLITTIAWMRIIGLLFLGLILFVFCLVFCIAICRGTTNNINQQRETLSRIPVVNSFLTSHSRSYDPTKDAGVEECVICLDPFSTEDKRQIAELNCSNKHIFHLDCIKSWVESG